MRTRLFESILMGTFGGFSVENKSAYQITLEQPVHLGSFPLLVVVYRIAIRVNEPGVKSH